jgi:hypothetical protein
VTFPPERVMSALAPIAEKMARAVEAPAPEATAATSMTGAEVAELRRKVMKKVTLKAS